MQDFEARSKLLRQVGTADRKSFTRGVVGLGVFGRIVDLLNGSFVGKRKQNALPADGAAMDACTGKASTDGFGGLRVRFPAIGLANDARWMIYGVG
jgi:hypothetical protein